MRPADLLLAPAGAAWRGIMRARNLLFDRRVLSTQRLPVPVVSVGNLAFGGTGKTPMVAWVARRLLEAGRRPAVLSRGYAARGGALDDENEMLRAQLPDVPVLTGARRARVARDALERGIADVFVLDDGFQHRRLARDLDLVMLDAPAELAGRARHREGWSALRRAHAAVLSRADQAPGTGALADRLRRRFPHLALALARHRPLALTPVHGGPPEEPRALAGRAFGAFCALGNPEGFRRTLAALAGAEPAFFRAFPDHHPYRPEDVRTLDERARELGLDLLVTTAKDAVKLRRLPAPEACPLVRLDIEIELLSGETELLRLLQGAAGL
jgi:tetraacyldisaccharide 4'-kinase